MDNVLSVEVLCLMEQFVRDMTQHNCGVFGLVYCGEPYAMGLIRNSAGSPVRQASILVEIVKQAADDGRIEEHIVPNYPRRIRQDGSV